MIFMVLLPAVVICILEIMLSLDITAILQVYTKKDVENLCLNDMRRNIYNIKKKSSKSKQVNIAQNINQNKTRFILGLVLKYQQE